MHDIQYVFILALIFIKIYINLFNVYHENLSFSLDTSTNYSFSLCD